MTAKGKNIRRTIDNQNRALRRYERNWLSNDKTSHWRGKWCDKIHSPVPQGLKPRLSPESGRRHGVRTVGNGAVLGLSLARHIQSQYAPFCTMSPDIRSILKYFGTSKTYPPRPNTLFGLRNAILLYRRQFLRSTNHNHLT